MNPDTYRTITGQKPKLNPDARPTLADTKDIERGEWLSKEYTREFLDKLKEVHDSLVAESKLLACSTSCNDLQLKQKLITAKTLETVITYAKEGQYNG